MIFLDFFRLNQNCFGFSEARRKAVRFLKQTKSPRARSVAVFRILHRARAEKIRQSETTTSFRELQKINQVRFQLAISILFFSFGIASSKTGGSSFSETADSAAQAETFRPGASRPAVIVNFRHQVAPSLTNKNSRPKLPNNANQHHHQHQNRNNPNYGSVETLSSFSSQSGSYHLPSSANFSTLPDRSLAESPHALQIDSDFEKYSEDESADALYSKKTVNFAELKVQFEQYLKRRP